MLLRPFNLDSFQPIKYILEEITLIYILLISCKLYAAAVISLQFTKKKIQIYQYLFYDYHLVHILATVWDYINVSFKFRCFCTYISRTPLNKAYLTLATQSKFSFNSSDLKSTADSLSFEISFVPNESKTFGTLFPYYR